MIPTYGESRDRGFYLQNGGYYWAMSEYTDLTILGDIYSHGSWALKPIFNYKYRYHYNGTFNLSTATTVLGSQGSPDYSKTKDYRIYWVHNQDPKARPRSRFSANVNIVSNTYNKNNLSGSVQNYLSNQFQSSINYSTSWADFYYLNVNASHSQNTLDSTISFTFPQISFSVNQFYPFRPANRVGKKKWYDNINVKYNLDAENRYSTKDNELFLPGWEKLLRNGIKHTVPISSTITLLKYINWTTGINLNDRMYFQSIRKKYVLNQDTATTAAMYKLVSDTLYGFVNAFDANFSTSLSTRLYGMFQLKAGPVLAVRHMVVPSVSFSYQPDFGTAEWGYWRYAANDTTRFGTPQKYSIFENSIYGSPPPTKAGIISFMLKNNLEMKVRNRKDTVTGTKKIMLIEDFTLRSSYDLARDTIKWSKIFISGYTTLFKSLRIQYGSTWDMYARDSKGNRINQTEWQVSHKLLRLDNTTWDIGLNYSLASDKVKKKKSDKGTEQERQDVITNYEDYIDFDIPWSFSFNYNFHFTKDWDPKSQTRKGNIVQTLSFNGQMNLTPKWKVILVTGYDFVNKEISYTRIDISRDLHCWEMRFGWVPKGYQQSWEFSINVKAPLLQDLKLNKKKDFRTAF
ncbi:MAG: putative LPS assembly protein LptD, partial [Syntrophothermus sp.]